MSDNEDPKTEFIKGSLEIAKTAYADALSPGAKEAGKALQTVGRVVNAALSPLTGLVWGYEQFQSWLEEKVASKLEGTPPEEIQTPKTSLAGPALEALRYCGEDEELSELFAGLLVTSMTKSTAQYAHPGFVEVIKNLTSDEAKIIKQLHQQDSWPTIEIRSRVDMDFLKSKMPEGESLPDEINPRSFRIEFRNLSLLAMKANCESPENIGSYIDNLARLGVVKYAQDHTLNPPAYVELEESDMVKEYLERAKQGGFMQPFIKRKKLDLTEFGALLVKACIKD